MGVTDYLYPTDYQLTVNGRLRCFLPYKILYILEISCLEFGLKNRACQGAENRPFSARGQVPTNQPPDGLSQPVWAPYAKPG